MAVAVASPIIGCWAFAHKNTNGPGSCFYQRPDPRPKAIYLSLPLPRVYRKKHNFLECYRVFVVGPGADVH
jgi:hypothetical protein